MALNCIVEGRPDEAVVRRLANEAGLPLGRVHVKHGRTQIKLNLNGYDNAARFGPWLVLVDLDRPETPKFGEISSPGLGVAGRRVRYTPIV